MKFLTTFLLFLLTIISMESCGSKNVNSEQDSFKIPPFKPNFPSVSNQYIQQKRKHIYPFYNQILGKDRFNGMFLVAKNGKIIFEKVNGFLDYNDLKELWSEDSLKLAIPFYDSFIYINNLSFGNAVPDISFTKPTLFFEENDLALDFILKEKDMKL